MFKCWWASYKWRSSSSYLGRGPRLVLWAAIHCDRFVHVLVDLRKKNKQSQVSSLENGNHHPESNRWFPNRVFFSTHHRTTAWPTCPPTYVQTTCKSHYIPQIYGKSAQIQVFRIPRTPRNLKTWSKSVEWAAVLKGIKDYFNRGLVCEMKQQHISALYCGGIQRAHNS